MKLHKTLLGPISHLACSAVSSLTRDVIVKALEQHHLKREASKVYTFDQIFGSPYTVVESADFRLDKFTSEVRPVNPRKYGETYYWTRPCLTGTLFEHITFRNCYFDYIDLSESVFNHVVFENCTMEGVLFTDCVLNEVIFKNCELHKSSFNHASLTFVKYVSVLQDVSFIEAMLHNVLFQSLERCNLFKCKIVECSFQSVQDCILEGYTSTKPKILMLKDFVNYSQVYLTVFDRIVEQNGLPFNLDYLYRFKQENVKNEIEALLQLISNKPKTEKSVPEHILDLAEEHSKDFRNIHTIIQVANEFVDVSDGVLLYGGSDIHPFWYSQENNGSRAPENEYRRDVFEFALIKALNRSQNRNKPLLAICRGLQILNIYYGGTLTQEIKTKTKHTHNFCIQKLQIIADTNLPFLSNIETFESTDFHHQAIDKLGKELIPFVESYEDHLIEGVTIKDRRVIGVQFHPEFRIPFDPKDVPNNTVDGPTITQEEYSSLLSEANTKIFEYFIAQSNLIGLHSPLGL